MGIVMELSEPALDLALYGDKSGILNNYLSQQLQNIKPAYNEFSNRIYQCLQSSYNFVNNQMVKYGLLNQLDSNGIQALDNYYTDLTSCIALQNANATMQRWIMAHPDVRKLYLDQNIDGYSGSYQNVFGKEIGEDDYNYRRVMDGVMCDEGDITVVRQYLDDLLEGDRELNHYEKVKILHTYDAIDYLLKECKFDFTCKSDEPSKINRG